MSHERAHDRIELQSYFSETGSLASATTTPNGTLNASAMSASGSFTGSGAVPVPHTDTDNQQNPTYSSIPEAQTSHQQYRVAQLRQQPASSPVHVPIGSAPIGSAPIGSAPINSPPSGHAPSGYEAASGAGENGEIQYELIPDKHKAHTTAPLPAGVTKQADNILYVDTEAANELHMRHKTLTLDKVSAHKRFEGSLSPEPHDFHKEGGGACKRACLFMLVFLLCALLVLALAAGALSLAIIFTGIVDSPLCDCPAASEIQGLMDRVQTLEVMLGQTTPSSEQPSVMTTPPDVSAMTTMATPTPLLPGGVAMLGEVDLYEGCNTTVEQSCVVTPLLGSCLTDDVFLNNAETYMLNMNCVRDGESDESNPLILTLDRPSPNVAACICSVLGEFDSNPRANDVQCGIQVTRCPRPLNITATIG